MNKQPDLFIKPTISKRELEACIESHLEVISDLELRLYSAKRELEIALKDLEEGQYYNE